MAKYDFLIVGAGIFGSTCARLLTDKGYRCLIVERNSQVGGLCHDYESNGLLVTSFGPHVLHTDNDEVWKFLSKYAEMNDYVHTEMMMKDSFLFRLPVDMLTINTLFKHTTSQSAYKTILTEIKNYNVTKPKSLEDLCVMNCGTTIYTYLLKDYYEKKFGRKCSELALNMPFIFPISMKHESKFYPEKYQGYPKEGYVKMIENIIGDDIDVMLNVDFCKNIEKYISIANIVLYTGASDELCHYCFGALSWATASFVKSDETIRGNYIYGAPVINVENKNNDILRIVEHKWFTPERLVGENSEVAQKANIITYEHAKKWEPGDPTLYALIDTDSAELQSKYANFVNEHYPNLILCGKNASFDNFTMCESVEGAMALCNAIKRKNEINQ